MQTEYNQSLAPAYATEKTNRVGVTAQFAWDNLCDVTLYVYRDDETESWLTIDGGMDRIIKQKDLHAGEMILCYGKTGEMHVSPRFIVYANLDAVSKAINHDKELDAVIDTLPKLTQRSSHRSAQVLLLLKIASKLGLTEAADVLRRGI